MDAHFSKSTEPFISSVSSPEVIRSQPEELEREREIEMIFRKHLVIIDKIAAQPERRRHIAQLNREISRIEEAVAGSKEVVASLEGGKAAKVPILGIAIKWIFKLYYRNALAREDQQRRTLEEDKISYQKQIENLRTLLPTAEEEHPTKILEIEHELRALIQTDIPNPTKHQRLYEEKIFPLVKEIKLSIEKPLSFPEKKAREVQVRLLVISLFSSMRRLSPTHQFKEMIETGNQLRELLEKEDFPEKSKYREAYSSVVVPLMEKAALVIAKKSELELLFNHLRGTSPLENPGGVIEIGRQLQSALIPDFPGKVEYQKTYDETILPVIRQAEGFMAKKARIESLLDSLRRLSPSENPSKVIEVGNQLREILVADVPEKARYIEDYKRLAPIIQQAEELIAKRAREEEARAKVVSLAQAFRKLSTFENPSKVIEIGNQLKEALTADFPENREYRELYETPLLRLIQCAHEIIAEKAKVEVEALFKALDELPATAAVDQPDKVFELQHQLEINLEKDFPEKAKYARLYHERVGPLVEKAKQAIVRRPMHFAAQAAAAKGKAVQAGLTALIKLAENRPVIKNSDVSAQEVFLLPKEEAVFKRSSERAKEEESIISSLFDLMSNQAIVGAFDIRKPALKPYGIQVPQDIRTRGFQSTRLPLPLLTEIRLKLSQEDRLLLERYGRSEDLYLSPDLSNPTTKRMYRECEKFKWKCIDRFGVVKEVDFKTFHALNLQRQVYRYEPIVPSGKVAPTSAEIHAALSVGWKAFYPQILQEKIGAFGEKQLTEIEDIQAKPFVSDMILMGRLDSAAQEHVLNRLSDADQVNAVLTSELQFLDLHSSNLGVEPESNENYEYFKNFQFTVRPGGSKDFKTLLTDYISGRIAPHTMIEFEDKGRRIIQPLEALPELRNALNVKWKLVLFDTDLSLSEDNRLSVQGVLGGGSQRLVPLRSVLLETSWKDKPLSEAAVKSLMDSDERDLKVKQWISNEDAPIYKQLSPSAKTSVQTQVAPLIERYSLSAARLRDDKTTIKALRNQFAKDISDMSKPENVRIWETLERDLTNVSIRPGDTWETLAKRHNQNADTLRILNPGALPGSGGKIEILYDLTSNLPQAVKAREKIAKQLFPRITFRQQAALIERQQNRKTYLNSYRELVNSTLTGEALLNQMEAFIKRSTTPLSSLDREAWLADLATHRAAFLRDPTLLLNSKNELCKICQPTYFNLSKAMYPLLADAYALNQWVYKDNASAGRVIGHFAEPLEVTIAKAKSRFPLTSPAVRLALGLEARIRAIPDPAFHRYME